MKSLEVYFQYYKNNIFFESEDFKLTFLEFKNVYEMLAKKLKLVGIKKNHYVQVRLENNIYSAVVIFSLASMGAIPCLTSTRKNAKSNMRFDFELTEQVLQNILSLNSSSAVDLETDPSKLKIVLCTSGSSSQPKPALLSFENLLWNALGSNENIPFAERDLWHWSLPIYHVGGLAILFRALVGGGAVTLNERTSTHVSWVQTQLYRNLNQPINKKSILLGGSAISQNLIDLCIRKNLPIHTSYGMTEMASQICTDGKLLKYRELKIVNDEIFVKGATLFKGYLDNPNPFDQDGWFATKDLGKMTTNGIVILGRKDRMFISAGENIQPEYIEQTIMQYPGISRARVVPTESIEYGMRTQAYVESANTVDYRELKGFLQERLTGLQVPENIFDFSKLPVAPTKDF